MYVDNLYLCAGCTGELRGRGQEPWGAGGRHRPALLPPPQTHHLLHHQGGPQQHPVVRHTTCILQIKVKFANCENYVESIFSIICYIPMNTLIPFLYLLVPMSQCVKAYKQYSSVLRQNNV